MVQSVDKVKMLDTNDTWDNTTEDDDIFSYPTTNFSLLPEPLYPGSFITNFSLNLFSSLDYSQLLYRPECHDWVPLNHIYFQVANIFLLISSLAPAGSGGLLFIRSMHVVAFSFSTVWGLTVACGLDTTAWNTLLTAVHLVWCLTALWRRRSVSLSKEMEMIYIQMFQPLKVSRGQFQTLLSVTKEIRRLAPKEVMIQEKVSRVDSLSLVVKGRLIVSQAGRALHLVTHHQFLDSPEWFGVTTDEYFQVTVTALEECSLLVWHRDKIKLVIMEDPHLQAVLDHVVGRDVVRKLMQVHSINEELSLNKNLVIESNDNISIGEDKEDYDDKKPMIAKESSLMATIIGGDLSNWRLGKIRETEDETIV